MKLRFIENGNLSGWVCTVLIAVGMVMFYVALEYVSNSFGSLFLLLLGFALMAIAGTCSRAGLLGIRPFDNEYKKAKKTYDTQREEH